MRRVSQTELSTADFSYCAEGELPAERFVGDAGDEFSTTSLQSLRTWLRPVSAPLDAVSQPASLKSPALVLRDIAGVQPATRLERPPVPRVPFGIAQVDALTRGLPRGCLTEICGAPSSGRTTLMIAAIAATTARGELCALVDASDCFDPHSALAAGVDLERLLWIRCATTVANQSPTGKNCILPGANIAGVRSTLQQKQAVGSVMPHAKVWYGRSPARSERVNDATSINATKRKQPRRSPADDEFLPNKNNLAPGHVRACNRRQWARCVDQALRATDLLLQGGGFGLIVIDLGDVPCEIARRVPLTSWFRFRRAVENTPALLLSIVQQTCAKTCASLVLEMHGHRRAADTNSDKLQPRPSSASPTTRTNHSLQQTTEIPAHARIFTGLEVAVEVARVTEQPTNEKKPPRPPRTAFESQTEWTTKYDRAIWPSRNRAIG